MISREVAIKFAIWLREGDTQERPCERFGITDEDMLEHFLTEVLETN